MLGSDCRAVDQVLIHQLEDQHGIEVEAGTFGKPFDLVEKVGDPFLDGRGKVGLVDEAPNERIGARFEPLGEQHDRGTFHCGEEALDRYFQTQATQDIRRRVATCFVAIEVATGQVAAYYTLSASSILLVDLPPE